MASKHVLEVAVVNQMVPAEFKRGQGFPITNFEVFYNEPFSPNASLDFCSASSEIKQKQRTSML